MSPVPESGECPASQPLLSVRKLATEFRAREGVFKAVRQVSFDLERSAKLGIVGESGSGKSALALSILGLIASPGRITGGEVWLNGRDLRALSERELRRVRGREVSLVFQNPMTALDPVKTIGSQIEEGLRFHQPELGRTAWRARAIELLEDVEVPSAARRLGDYPHHFSGGMRQRVMIAIALANSPDLLIADEPTTALDVTTQAQVLDVIERLVTEQGTAVILITHNLGIIADFCDTVQVMYSGRIVERGAAENIFHNPAHPYTEALLKSVPRPDRMAKGPLFAIPGIPASLANLPRGCAFEPRCPRGRGNPRCLREAPRPIAVGPSANPVLAECHYAQGPSDTRPFDRGG